MRALHVIDHACAYFLSVLLYFHLRRNNPMRRRFGRILRSAPQPPHPVLADVQHANRLMEARDYSGAASAFEKLAHEAKKRNGAHTPFFFLQAGRARLLMNDPSKGLVHFKYGLILLADTHRYTQFYRAGTRIVQELKMHKLEKESQEISALIHGHTSAIAEMATQQLPHDKTFLPTHCPSCSGPVRSDEIDWIDDRTAECSFCGSSLQVG
jgi:hypothetical protein